MRLRETLIGAGITLVVTVVAGLVVWMLTEWQLGPRSENLVYEVERTGSFDYGQTRLSLYSIRAANVGGAPASDIVLQLSFAAHVAVREVTIDPLAGMADLVEQEVNGNAVRLRVGRLLPAESISATIFLEGIQDSAPTTSLRSNQSIGVLGSDGTQADESRSVWIDVFAAVFSGFAAMGAMLAARHLRLKRLEVEPFDTNEPNNVAFVYVHSGLPDEAISILQKVLHERGGGPGAMSSYALAHALLGKDEKADQYFAAAEAWTFGGHERAVVEFNKSVRKLAGGDAVGAVEPMKRARLLPIEVTSASTVELARSCARRRGPAVRSHS